jgi:diacylglycerol kinase (ATP)
VIAPPKPGGKRGIARLIAATGYSMKGLRAAFRHEEAFRMELVLSAVLIMAALFLSRSFVEGVVLILPLILMLVAELANSAIEAIVDRIGPEHHELSGRAKDIGSATVFLTFGFTAVVWGAFLYLRFVAG